jgi:hypothetical protein
MFYCYLQIICSIFPETGKIYFEFNKGNDYLES